MNVRIKKRSKRFAESMEEFKASGIVKIAAIESLMASLKHHCEGFAKGHLKSNHHFKQFVDDLDNLVTSVNVLSQHVVDGTDRLVKDYGWLENKLSLLEDERKNFKIMYELSSVLDDEKDLEKILKSVAVSLTKILNAEYGIVELIDDEGNVRLGHEVSSKNNNAVLLELKNKAVEAAVDSGSSIVMNSLILKNKRNGSRERIGSVMCLPLKSDENVIGTMYFGTFRKNFTADETDLLEALGKRITQAVENNIKYNQFVESSQKLLADLRTRYDFDDIIGDSPQIAVVLSTITDIAGSDTTVLIEGESGTGKEVIAEAIHKNSPRKKKPFIPINCSAIPETLLESELFGYEKGAFTGAVGRKPGKFELADGGTILLDEVGELSTILQVKLLRFLQSHEFEPLGSTKVIRSDVRIIAATKRDLAKMVQEGEFRDDLFYRINVIKIVLPPLRERQGDIPSLVNHFIRKYAEKNNKAIEGINKEALNVIQGFDFPGNIRELENVIERAIVLCKNKILGIDDLPDHVKSASCSGFGAIPRNIQQLAEAKNRLMEGSVGVLERNFIIRALRNSGGNISEAARITRMHRKQFQRLMQRHNLHIQDIFVQSS